MNKITTILLILLVGLTIFTGCTKIKNDINSNAIKSMKFKQCAGRLDLVDNNPRLCLESAKASYKNIIPDLEESKVTCKFSSEVYETLSDENSIAPGRKVYCQDCECEII